MANLVETGTWEAGIYQLETTDPVVGGVDGISNKQAKQLANRTKYLKEQIEGVNTGLSGALATKREINDSFSKTETNNLLAAKLDAQTYTTEKENFATKEEVSAVNSAAQNALNTKLNAEDTAADSLKLGGLEAERYALKSEISDGLKIGSYLLWSSESHTPAGFLVCDGRSLAKAEYAELFAVIGYTYGGSGDDFNIPNFSDGKFFRSVGGNAAPVGEAQQDAIREHNHKIRVGSGHTADPTDPTKNAPPIYLWGQNGVPNPPPSSFIPTLETNGSSTANENRPYNMSVVVLIKAKDAKEPTSGQIDDSIYATETKAGIVKLKNSVTGNAEDTAVTEKAVKDVIDANKSIGIEQTWQDMTSQRQPNITYTNTTGRPIVVSITCAGGSLNMWLSIDSHTNCMNEQASPGTLTAIIPPNSTYRLTTQGTLTRWMELR